MKHFLPIVLAVSVASSLAIAAPQTQDNAKGKGRKAPANTLMQSRGCKIVVSRGAPKSVQNLVNQLIEGQDSSKTLMALADGKPLKQVVSEDLLAGSLSDRAYPNLVVVGLMDDPLVQQVWQREAKIEGNRIYVHGVGRLEGDIGYIESERNPFLYSSEINKVPYTAMVVTLTGTTPKGVELAVRAFLDKGLVNGTVAGSGWIRYDTSLLDQPPLRPEFEVPTVLPENVGDFRLIGLTACSEPDYRGVLAVTGERPSEMWRAKYNDGKVWNKAGAKESFFTYLDSLHRKAYGSSVLAIRFADPKAALQAAQKMAASARMKKDNNGRFSGQQPMPSSKGFRDPGNPDPKTWKAPYTMWTEGEWVLFSSVSVAGK